MSRIKRASPKALILRLFKPMTIRFIATGLFILLLPSFVYADTCHELLEANGRLELAQETILLKDLDELQSLISQISSRYPIGETEFVFVGRSPSLLAAYAEVQGEVFSNLRGWVLPVSLSGQREVSMSQLKQNFLTLFEFYRPSHWPKDRKLVFIDFVMAGRTFNVLERLMIESNIEAEFLGFNFSPQNRQLEIQAHQNQIPMNLLPISFEMEMRLSEHKSFAPYSSHNILSSSYDSENVSKEVSANFKAAKKLIRTHTLGDF